MEKLYSKKWIWIIGLITAAAVINPSLILKAAGFLFSMFRPVIIGMVIAFVLNRPACVIFDLMYDLRSKSVKNKNKNVNRSFYIRSRIYPFYEKNLQRKIWLVSVASAYLLAVILLTGIILIIVPQLAESLETLWSNGGFYRLKLTIYYNELKSRDTLGILPAVAAVAEKISEAIPSLLGEAYSQAMVFIGGIADVVIGIVISVYILIGKSDIRRAVQNIARRFIPQEKYDKLAAFYRRVYDIFSRFVTGQLTEAAVLGVLCYIGMKLFRFEYALLISVIIGVTALVPVVGAIVGTVPCAFLLFLTEPMSAVWFVVFIIILQQLENNFIYPKIVGKSMGLPPLPVLIAILIGAKLGGGFGILLSVPLTAVFYGIYKEKMG